MESQLTLTPNQKRELRRLVEISTFLRDVRFTVYERWKGSQEKVGRAKRDLAEIEKKLRNAWEGSTDEAELKRKHRECAEIVRELTEASEGLSKQVEAMTPDVDRAGRLADRLLAYSGRNAENLGPAVMIGGMR